MSPLVELDRDDARQSGVLRLVAKDLFKRDERILASKVDI
jgi:hypothetical protein